MVYTGTQSESQIVMRWKLIFKEFGTNIQNISGFENIVADTMSILPPTYVDKYYTRKTKT